MLSAQSTPFQRRSASGLWTKLHKRRPYTRGSSRIVRMAAIKAARAAEKQAEAMVTDSAADDDLADVETRAPSAMVGTSPSASSSSSPPSKKAAEKALPAAGEAPEPMAISLPPAPAVQKPKRQVVMLPSVFEGRPPVLFFSYTAACLAKQRPMERAVYADIDGPRLFYSHTDAVHEYNAVINIMRQGGLYRVKADTNRWLVMWSNHPPPEVLQAMKPQQRTNHFPGSWHLGRKDRLWQNISRMQRKFSRSYNITPQGYILPKGFPTWDQARIRQPDALWIWKPCSQSCGRGIKVFSSNITPEEAKDFGRKRGVIQRYIPNPLLIDGYKFDLRIYVVVLSYDPLKVYINDEGLVRLATTKYSSDPSSLDSRTMHLTNYSVNKLSPDFVQNKDVKSKKAAAEGDENEGAAAGGEDLASKWSLKELKEYFAKKGLDYNLMYDRIKDVAIKTLIAVEEPMMGEWSKGLDDEEAGWLARGISGAHNSSTNSCFEIYGFDVLVDTDLRPWLLEVNICPSLSSGSPLDKRIKTKLVADTLTLVGVKPPPIVWKHTPGAVHRPSSDMDCDDADDSVEASAIPGDEIVKRALADDLVKRAAKLAACSAEDAIALFDEVAWELVMESHDQEMRRGGLERIFPTAQSSKFSAYFEQESYFNLVLRRFYEAGGGALFGMPSASLPNATAAPTIPPWVPRQVEFRPT
eukprot:TRINITY_DN5869_c0_g1_i2.p1 TRINITY_DN5869_c0_g1~~TRINITY_DN5869_c0_g1_i2.p1  ORF type:complete len:695 (-),score=158.93 TRINITY_DN5869_c0_g1_i2:161-2245(-)